MSYRDHLEAQKKYVRTKKEALEAKRDRERNPRPPKYDPPPAPTSPWLVITLATLALLPFLSLFFLLQSTLVTQTPREELTIWICSSELEFDAIKKWLEPEILANELTWSIVHAESKDQLLYALRNAWIDLAIMEEEFARELYEALALAPLWEKLEGPTWGNAFIPFWNPQPFRKTFGWVVPSNGRITEGRHLFTVMRQFAQPFNP
ncbi:MAG: hypothetical protein GX971_02060 [Firmicutes bacterium]|nr:hypothetical protein [Bacillota bacterium]